MASLGIFFCVVRHLSLHTASWNELVVGWEHFTSLIARFCVESLVCFARYSPLLFFASFVGLPNAPGCSWTHGGFIDDSSFPDSTSCFLQTVSAERRQLSGCTPPQTPHCLSTTHFVALICFSARCIVSALMPAMVYSLRGRMLLFSTV
jgi:hypothetical protein